MVLGFCREFEGYGRLVKVAQNSKFEEFIQDIGMLVLIIGSLLAAITIVKDIVFNRFIFHEFQYN